MFKIVVLLVCASAALGDFQRPGLYLNGTTGCSNTRVINGVDANEGDFPYAVSFNYPGDGHVCGASILTPDWALTAAHCCLVQDNMEIYAGSIYLSKGGTRYAIEKMFIHEDYDSKNHWRNDICAIKMAKPIQLGPNVQPVTLPTQGMDVPPSASLTFTGWGVDANGQGPDRLQVLYNAHALTLNDCINKTGVDLIPGHLCSYAGAQHGVCSGDSGGPLTMNGVQVGITSWVWFPCGKTGMPDIFTRVPEYINWIKNILANNAKDLKFAKPEDLL